jgi:hypothetical protein
MPWVKPILNEVGLVGNVKCCVCTNIERKEKVFVIKWDSIEKYTSNRKILNGKWFMDLECGHVINEIFYG